MSRGPPTPGTKTSGRSGPGASGPRSVTGNEPPWGGRTTVIMSRSLAERARPRLDKVTAPAYDAAARNRRRIRARCERRAAARRPRLRAARALRRHGPDGRRLLRELPLLVRDRAHRVAARARQ